MHRNRYDIHVMKYAIPAFDILPKHSKTIYVTHRLSKGPGHYVQNSTSEKAVSRHTQFPHRKSLTSRNNPVLLTSICLFFFLGSCVCVFVSWRLSILAFFDFFSVYFFFIYFFEEEGGWGEGVGSHSFSLYQYLSRALSKSHVFSPCIVICL